jgi:branched-chain amino acid transport system substrate-binding protein
MNAQKLFCPDSVVAALIIVLVVGSTSCGPGAVEPPVMFSPTVSLPGETPTTRPTETPVPTTTIPTETLTPFVPKATFKIASHSPLSGDQAILGTDIMRGASLAVRQLADPLMDLGYQIRLVPRNDENSPRIAVSVAKEIVADPDVLCTVGPYTSSILNEVKEIYHQAGLAFISPSATAAFASGSNYLEVNRVVGRHDSQGAAGAQFAKAQGFSRVFIISQSENYSRFNAYYFRNEASRLGLEVVGNMTTNVTKKFGSIIDRILATNADLVYFSTLSEEQAGVFFREARTAGYDGAFLGNEGIASSALLEYVGSSEINEGGLYYTTIAAPATYYPEAATFVEDFKTLFGEFPQMFAAQAYDAAGICMKAIEEASKAKSGEIPSRADVANAVRALHHYPGITDVFNFNANGDPDPAQYFVFQVTSTEPFLWNQNQLIASFEVSPPQ